MHKRIINEMIIVITVFLVLVFALLMTISIPKNNRWWLNFYKSYDELVNEGDYPSIINFGEQKWDNYTAAIFLNMLYFIDNKHPIISETKLELATTSNSGSFVYDNIGALLENDNVKSWYYSRYWCGYNIILYPFLFFSSINSLRILMFYITLSFDIYIIYYYIHIGKRPIGFSLAIASIMAQWLFNCMCIVYGIDIMLALITIIVWNKAKNHILPESFAFLIGGLTMFLCMLSTPLITLGMWLVIILYESDHNSFIQNFLELIKVTVSWILGYLFMMECKGLLVKSAGLNETANSRLIYLVGKADIVERLKICYSLYVDFVSEWLCLIVFVAIAIIVCLLKNGCNSENFKSKIVVMLVALFPFLWEFIFNAHTNHGVEKTLYVISLFAIFVFLFSVIERNDAFSN